MLHRLETCVEGSATYTGRGRTCRCSHRSCAAVCAIARSVPTSTSAMGRYPTGMKSQGIHSTVTNPRTERLHVLTPAKPADSRPRR